MTDNLILTADWHLRNTRPRARRDEDWLHRQQYTLDFIAEEANKRKAKVCISGDIFDSAVVPDRIKNMFLDFVNKVDEEVYILAGNHDLPGNSIENINSSSIGVVMKGKGVGHLSEIAAAHDFDGEILKRVGDIILFTHQLTFESKYNFPPNVKAKTAQQLLDEYPWAEIIVTGDNHQCFVYESGKDERKVINPGTILRHDADEIDYRPQIIYLDKELNVEFIDVPDDDDMITNDYIIEKKEKMSNIAAFIETVKDSGSISLDYKNNVEKKMLTTNLGIGVINVIHKLLERS